MRDTALFASDVTAPAASDGPLEPSTRAARSGFFSGNFNNPIPGDLVARFGAGYDTTPQECRLVVYKSDRESRFGGVNVDAS
jgi:hypothetical protein